MTRLSFKASSDLYISPSFLIMENFNKINDPRILTQPFKPFNRSLAPDVEGGSGYRQKHIGD